MKILFHIEPLVFHGRPLHYFALLDFFVKLAGCLRAANAVDTRFITSQALARRAIENHGLEADRVYGVSGRALRDATQVSSMETLRILQRGDDAELQSRLMALYRNELGTFQPDVVIGISPSPYWRQAFPKAIHLHVDGGLFSRDPLPHVFFMDVDGLFQRSSIAVHADELKALPPSPQDQAFLNLLRAEFRQRILRMSSFHEMERDLRTRFRRLLLLPLQFAGEFGFDLHCSYDRQGSFLLDVAQRVSSDTAVIVAEHPTAIWLGDVIDQETRDYVTREFPNVVFAPGAREGIPHAGQTLLQHCDAVASVSSSLGMQAVFFNKPLLALGSSHLAEYASWCTVEDFNEVAPQHDFTGAIAWMMRHYYAPSHLWRDGRRMAEYLESFLRNAPQEGLRRYPALARDEELLGVLFSGASLLAA